MESQNIILKYMVGKARVHKTSSAQADDKKHNLSNKLKIMEAAGKVAHQPGASASRGPSRFPSCPNRPHLQTSKP